MDQEHKKKEIYGELQEKYYSHRLKTELYLELLQYCERKGWDKLLYE